MSNFEFLKKIDKDLYNIVYDAENLYRDEYFEQCMTQTRRFAEAVTKNMLNNTNLQTNTFDEMLNCLKDKSKGNPREKEFIDDLYFLKQNGNKSVHSKKVTQDGIVALECLQRAFEVAINYFVSIKGEDKKILGLNFDIDLLITGKKSDKTLSEKYIEIKEKNIKNQSQKIYKKKKDSDKKHKNQLINKTIQKKQKAEMSLFKKIFWTLVGLVCLLLTFMIYINFIKYN